MHLIKYQILAVQYHQIFVTKGRSVMVSICSIELCASSPRAKGWLLFWWAHLACNINDRRNLVDVMESAARGVSGNSARPF